VYCPFCRETETKVTDSRLVQDGYQIRRRRECLSCKERFTTYEAAELSLPLVIKNDKRRDAFDEGKLRAGIMRSLEKRPIGSEQIEAAVGRIIHKLRDHGESEVSSTQLGEWVMLELQKLDHVAYVRFASVYRSFKDVNEFREAIKHLEKIADADA
jgi:transcriptional repressor NrdR